jgi:hypothetical protein
MPVFRLMAGIPGMFGLVAGMFGSVVRMLRPGVSGLGLVEAMVGGIELVIRLVTPVLGPVIGPALGPMVKPVVRGLVRPVGIGTRWSE